MAKSSQWQWMSSGFSSYQRCMLQMLRCSPAEGTAACGARGRPLTGVICDRYMCPRTVEAPGACARGSGVEKSRTVPGAVLQRRPAGDWRRRGRQRRGLRDACPRWEPDGGHRAPAPEAARSRSTRWAPPACRGCPDVSLAVGPRGSAGAARARPRRRQRARGAC
jgi:hypothetical protein